MAEILFVTLHFRELSRGAEPDADNAAEGKMI